jgi:hypothetical protein
MSVIPREVASAVPPERLTALHNTLGRVRESEGFAFGLADGRGGGDLAKRLAATTPCFTQKRDT